MLTPKFPGALAIPPRETFPRRGRGRRRRRQRSSLRAGWGSRASRGVEQEAEEAAGGGGGKVPGSLADSLGQPGAGRPRPGGWGERKSSGGGIPEVEEKQPPDMPKAFLVKRRSLGVSVRSWDELPDEERADTYIPGERRRARGAPTTTTTTSQGRWGRGGRVLGVQRENPLLRGAPEEDRA